ncbi:MAG: LPS export ABC transporter permease LptF [Alphaproteobacteria bacterium]|nr:LPS export ABC transporter permease LptF [Alphaproteobacteria bacterium]
MNRYIFRQIGISVLFVAVALTVAIWLTQSLQYVDYIVNRGLSLATFLYFTMLLMPSLLVIILPMALFISVLFIYNRMTVDRELVVMRAAGLSPFQLSNPAMTIAMLVTLAGYSFNLYFLPVTFRTFKDLESAFRTDLAGIILQEGKFNTISDTFTVYVRERESSGELRGILAHDSRTKERPITYMAERGALVSSVTGPRVLLVKGLRQEVDRKTGRTTMLSFERNTVDLSIFSRAGQRSYREPAERFLHELFWPGDSRSEQHYRDKLRAEGHQRLVSPLLSLTFTLICLAALLSGDFDRKGQTRRVLTALALVVLIQAASFGLFNLAAKEPLVTPLMYLNAIAPGLAAFFVLVKDPGWLTRRRMRDTPAAAAT